MTIRIAARLHPFSHLPGALCLLPQTHLKLQIFPTRVHFSLFGEDSFLFSLTWDIAGPVKDFTVEMDLEQQQIIVFGMTKAGYMRYRLRRQEEGNGIVIILDKIPGTTISCHLSHHNQTYQLSRGETVLIPRTFVEQSPVLSLERLSLGMHKAQDWQLIRRRLDLKEIFPLWMRLGQMTPSMPPPSSTKGNLRQLRTCTEVVEEERKAEIIPSFIELFLAAFEGICVPRLLDTDYQGLTPFEKADASDPSPIPILTHGAFLIRSLFFKESAESIALLPCLPADFHAGRMLEMNTLLGDRIDFEWSKKQLRKIYLQPRSERTLHLKVPRILRTCCVRTSLKEKGKEHAVKEGVLLLEISPGTPLFIDRFQK